MGWINPGRSRPAAQSKRFEALLRPHVSALYTTAYRYTGCREDAEDLVQDLLVKLYPRTGELERVEELRPWLTRSLYNAFIDRTRKSKRTPAGDGSDVAELKSPVDPHGDVLQAEQRQALNASIAALSPEHRAVVVLHLVEGYPLVELERILSVQLGTLKSRLHRAKAHLRKTLKAMEPDRLPERVNGHDL